MDKAVVRKAVHAFADWKSVSWMADADAWMGRRLWRTFQEPGLFEGRVDACVQRARASRRVIMDGSGAVTSGAW